MSTRCIWALLLTLLVCPASALSPHKSLSQFTRTVWTQAQGLPQDSVSTLAQTPDGYLWLGTSEGLVRFDGYQFVTFTRKKGVLPSSSILALYVSKRGTLWIGTNEGLASYQNGTFRTYGRAEGLPEEAVTSLTEDPDGNLWTVSVGPTVPALSYIKDGKAHHVPLREIPSLTSPREVYVDPEGTLWIAGVGGVVKRHNGAFKPVISAKDLRGVVVTEMIKTRDGLWLGTDQALFRYNHGQSVRRYTTEDGLPSNITRALLEDHDGNLWIGTFGGISRFENGRFVPAPPSDAEARGTVWELFEDREYNLWVGAQGSLSRFRDGSFTVYGKPEGLPSNTPMAVHEDKAGRVWVAYLDKGVAQLNAKRPISITDANGLPSNEIYRVRDGADGDLLIAGLGGLSVWGHGKIVNHRVPDPFGRTAVNDALLDSSGRLWAGAPSGLFRLEDGKWKSPARNLFGHITSVSEAPDHSIWAATFFRGVWRVEDGKARLFTTADGLGGNEVRSLLWDTDGTLWIGAFDGGLTSYRDGVFRRYRAADGLLSDNIAHVDDDHEGNLWLSTTRGICRIPKQQLYDFADGKIQRLAPHNYGLPHGLRSTHLAQSNPTGGGGTRTNDGRLWFTSVNGLVMVDPATDLEISERPADPIARITGITVDGHSSTSAELPPGHNRVEFNYVGLFLSAPESVRYSYKLEGFNNDWTPAEGARQVSYNNLGHGDYRFLVRATEPEGRTSEASFAFSVLPHFYETRWFILLATLAFAGALYGGYQLRIRQVQARYALVLEERARLAREIHDTLAQGFVGISHQLDALAGRFQSESPDAREHLDVARKMTRHSLTEARRSLMDLRLSDLQDQKLPEALSAAAQRWVAGHRIHVNLDIHQIHTGLSPDLEQNLFRIAQESIANVVKHAKATAVSLHLAMEGDAVLLAIADNGRGFDTSTSHSSLAGNFGILGMRERAERIGGTFSVASEPGSGTRVEVKVPSNDRRQNP